VQYRCEADPCTEPLGIGVRTRGRTSAGPLFSRGLHAAGANRRDIAYQNKAVIYDLLFKVSAETTLTIAALSF
jgi:hypothetical protein